MLRRFAPTFAVAAIVLAACGGQFTAPAAVVNGSTITVERLKREVEAGLAISGSPSSPEATADYSRQALAFLIRFEVAAGFARGNGISVSGDEVDAQLALLAGPFGGMEAFRQALAGRNIPLDVVRENAEMALLLDKVSQTVFEASGSASPTTGSARPFGGTPEEQAAFQKWLGDRIVAAEIDVNPRYGRLDRSNGSIVPIASTADLG